MKKGRGKGEGGEGLPGTCDRLHSPASDIKKNVNLHLPPREIFLPSTRRLFPPLEDSLP